MYTVSRCKFPVDLTLAVLRRLIVSKGREPTHHSDGDEEMVPERVNPHLDDLIFEFPSQNP